MRFEFTHFDQEFWALIEKLPPHDIRLSPIKPILFERLNGLLVIVRVYVGVLLDRLQQFVACQVHHSIQRDTVPFGVVRWYVFFEVE